MRPTSRFETHLRSYNNEGPGAGIGFVQMTSDGAGSNAMGALNDGGTAGFSLNGLPDVAVLTAQAIRGALVGSAFGLCWSPQLSAMRAGYTGGYAANTYTNGSFVNGTYVNKTYVGGVFAPSTYGASVRRLCQMLWVLNSALVHPSVQHQIDVVNGAFTWFIDSTARAERGRFALQGVWRRSRLGASPHAFARAGRADRPHEHPHRGGRNVRGCLPRRLRPDQQHHGV